MRRCPGIGKPCGKFLSNEKLDPHTLCHLCIGHRCSKMETCDQCVTWTDDQWSSYDGRRTYAKIVGKSPKTPSQTTPGPSETSLSPPVLEREVSPLFSTPKGRPLPNLPAVTPTPVKRLQQETKTEMARMRQSLTETFETKFDSVTALLKTLTDRMIPMAPPPGFPPIIPRTSTPLQAGEEVNVVVVAGDEEEEENSHPSFIKPPPETIVAYLDRKQTPVVQSKTSRALADMRQATSSANVLLGQQTSSDGRQFSRERSREKSRDFSRDTSRDSFSEVAALGPKDSGPHRSSKTSSRDRSREKRHEKDPPSREYVYSREKDREEETYRDKDRERDRDRERERTKDREEDLEREKDRGHDHDREKHRDRDREREKDRNRDREHKQASSRDREMDRERDRERPKDPNRRRERDQDKSMPKISKDDVPVSKVNKQKDNKHTVVTSVPGISLINKEKTIHEREILQLQLALALKTEELSLYNQKAQDRDYSETTETISYKSLQSPHYLKDTREDRHKRDKISSVPKTTVSSDLKKNSSSKNYTHAKKKDKDYSTPASSSHLPISTLSKENTFKAKKQDGQPSILIQSDSLDVSRSSWSSHKRSHPDKDDSRSDTKRRKTSPSRSSKSAHSEASDGTRSKHRVNLDNSSLTVFSEETTPVRAASPIKTRTPLEKSLSETADPEEDKALEANYSEVMEWIQEFSPEFDLTPQQKPSRPMSFVESVTNTDGPSTSRALPWSPGCISVMQELDSIVKGEPSSRRSTAPIMKPKLIPSYEFPYKFYRVKDVLKVNTPTLNQDFDNLLPSHSKGKKPKIDMTNDDCLSVETSAVKTRILTSSLDWQLVTVVKMLNHFTTTHGSTDPLLAKMHRLLQSAGKTTTQIQKESSILQANQILKRRDAALNLLPKQVNSLGIQKLRSSSFSEEHLFNPQMITEVIETTQTTVQREVNMKAVQEHPVPARNPQTPKKGKVTFKPNTPKKGSGNKNNQNYSQNTPTHSYNNQNQKSFSHPSPAKAAAGRGRGRGRGRGNQGNQGRP